jgi:kumamolisin
VNFPIPAYQIAAGVQPISKNDGNSQRGVPDVAGMVAMDGFFFAGVGGPGSFDSFGTNLVAPLYAGLTAVIEATLGRNVGFLNPILYQYGPEICNDVRFGNIESGNPPPDARGQALKSFGLGS